MSCFGGKNHFADDFSRLCPAALSRVVAGLCAAYPMLETGELTTSVMGVPIPVLRVGQGARFIVYVGAHHGMEWQTSVILLYFLDDLLDSFTVGRYAEGLSPAYILKTRTLLFIPMLNPDGVELATGGFDGHGILAERQRRMNGGDDFSHWQANARGVDLNHNYRTGFYAYKKLEEELGIMGGAPTRYSGEAPESEPESGALASLIRTLAPHAVYTFHTQGEEIYCGGADADAHVTGIARAFSGLSGYTLCQPEGPAAYGGLTDWVVGELGIPALTVECGRGENPLPHSDALMNYARLRRALFYSTIL